MDGLATLERLLAEHPVPVVMCSGLTESGADATIKALELGAFDFVSKPLDLAGLRKLVAAAIKAVRP